MESKGAKGDRRPCRHTGVPCGSARHRASACSWRRGPGAGGSEEKEGATGAGRGALRPALRRVRARWRRLPGAARQEGLDGAAPVRRFGMGWWAGGGGRPFQPGLLRRLRCSGLQVGEGQADRACPVLRCRVFGWRFGRGGGGRAFFLPAAATAASTAGCRACRRCAASCHDQPRQAFSHRASSRKGVKRCSRMGVSGARDDSREPGCAAFVLAGLPRKSVFCCVLRCTYCVTHQRCNDV